MTVDKYEDNEARPDETSVASVEIAGLTDTHDPFGRVGVGGGGVTIPLELETAETTDPALKVNAEGDTAPRMEIDGDGSVWFSDGTEPPAVGVCLDPENDGTNALGIFGAVDGDHPALNVYSAEIRPDGSGWDEPGITYVIIGAGRVEANTANAAAALSVADGGTRQHGRFVASLSTADPDLVASARGIELFGRASGGRDFSIAYDGVITFSNKLTGEPVLVIKPADDLSALKIVTPGGGIQFTSPDGLTTKTLTIDNDGDPVWT